MISKDDMNEKQLLAHCRKIKRRFSKKMSKKTFEHHKKYLNDRMKQTETEDGRKFTYEETRI
jgi:hypothetical protein